MTTKDTNKYIDRPFNIRPICFWAFFVGLTVAVCCLAKGSPLWIGIYFAVLLSVFVGLQFLKSRDKVLTFFGTSRINFIVTISLCLVVALSFAVTQISYTNQKSFAGYNDLSGVVENHKLSDDGSGWFIISNATFGTTTLGGKVAIYINNPNGSTIENVKSTYRITLNTQLRNANASDYNINNGIKYTANVSTNGQVESLGKDKSLRSVILRYSQEYFRKFMSDRNADLMYSMLFGDRSTLDGDINQSFSLTGLAHVLAVSGLHVGVIVGLLMVLLKLCRVRRKTQIPIITVVLLFYIYLCGFRYPIIRAALMFMVFLVRRAFLKSNDLLSSIATAAILILVLFPYSLLSVSFQASFACVLGIALFNLPFTNFWKKALRVSSDDLPKWRSWLVRGLAMYCTILLSFTPIMIRYFGFLPLFGIITNIFFLPLIILAFQASIISVLTWITFPLLYVANVGLNAIISATNWLASLPFSHIDISGGGYWFLLYYVGLIFTTRFIFMRPRYKYSVAAILILIYALIVIL